eukprot:6477474-Amphidinium_carterae.1
MMLLRLYVWRVSATLKLLWRSEAAEAEAYRSAQRAQEAQHQQLSMLRQDAQCAVSRFKTDQSPHLQIYPSLGINLGDGQDWFKCLVPQACSSTLLRRVPTLSRLAVKPCSTPHQAPWKSKSVCGIVTSPSASHRWQDHACCFDCHELLEQSLKALSQAEESRMVQTVSTRPLTPP